MQRILYELTIPQQQIWNSLMLNPGTSMYNITGYKLFYGEIDTTMIVKAFDLLIDKHDALHIRLQINEGQVAQYFSNDNLNMVSYMDYSTIDNGNYHFENWCKEQSTKPMALLDSSLYHFTVFKLKDGIFGFFVKLHHIIADGWSVEIISKKISQYYQHILTGEPLADRHFLSYQDYISLEKEYLRSVSYEKDCKFWNDIYQKIPEYIQETNELYNSKRLTLTLPDSDQIMLDMVLEKLSVSTSLFFLAIHCVYQYLVYDHTDIVVGIPVTGRRKKNEMSIMGMIVNTLPARFSINPEGSFGDVLKEINSMFYKYYRHRRYPYSQILSDIRSRGFGDIRSLYDICINSYNFKLSDDILGVDTYSNELHCGKQAYSLQTVIRSFEGQEYLEFDFDFADKKYTEADIRRIFNGWRMIVKSLFFNDSNMIIKDIKLVCDESFNEMYFNFNDTSCDNVGAHTVVDMFHSIMSLYPNEVAVVHSGQTITFTEIDQQSNKLSAYLRSKLDIGKGSLVGLCMGRGVNVIIGIMAVLKSGAAYVPIDFSYPIDRVNTIIENAEIRYIVCDSNCKNDMKELSYCKIIEIDAVNHEMFSVNATESKIDCQYPVIGASDIAYVIFTSGSKGIPKGVVVEHGSLANYIIWAKKAYGITKDDAFAFFTSISFDLTITSIFLPLTTGAKILAYEEDSGYGSFLEMLTDDKATIAKMTPAHLSIVGDGSRKVQNLKKIIVGGEILTSDNARRAYEVLGNCVEIYNEYGPTEATVGCMIHKYNKYDIQWSSVPIGHPIDNVKIYLLNKALQPVQMGEIGEICITGCSLAKGYLNNDELTDKLFIQNPFGEGRLYRTGDNAKFVAPEVMIYIGRDDNQVKVNGYRIELHEIESCAMKYPGVSMAVAVMKNNGNNSNLALYYQSIVMIEPSYIISHLEKYLPLYMIPPHVIYMKKIPLTVNGKINKEYLQQQCLAKDEFSIYEDQHVLYDELMRILELENQKISPSDNFFALGGDSIKAIKLSLIMEDKGINLPVKWIMEATNLQEMLDRIEPKRKKVQFQARQLYENRTIPSTPILNWFMQKPIENKKRYGHFATLLFHDTQTEGMMREMLSRVFAKKDNLHLRIANDSIYYIFNKISSICIQTVYLDDYIAEGRQEIISRENERAISRIDPFKGYIVSAVLYIIEEKVIQLSIAIHHIAVDSISWRILLHDIQQAMKDENYLGLSDEGTYERWCLAQNDISIMYQDEKSYWNQLAATTNDCFVMYNSNSQKIWGHVSINANLLKESCVRCRLNIQDVLLSSYLLALKIFLSESRFVIEIENSGRQHHLDDIDVSRTLGWFTSMYPAVFDNITEDLHELILNVKQTRQAVPNDGLGFMYSDEWSSLWRNEYSWIRFNYLGEIETVYESFSVDSFTEFYDEKMKATCALELNSFIFNDTVGIRMSIPEANDGQKAWQNFIYVLQQSVIRVYEYITCCELIFITPSDFPYADLTQSDLNRIFSD